MILTRKMIKLLTSILVTAMMLWNCTEDPIKPGNTGKIEGRILDAETNLPIADVGITTSPASSAVITDANGDFEILELADGTYTVRASKSGYKAGSVGVEVKSNKITTATILLTKSTTTNNSPEAPKNPVPANGAVNQSLSIVLSWLGTDPDKNDTLAYDLYFASANEQIKILSTGIKDSSFTVSGLLYNTVYFWQIVCYDHDGAFTNGPIWSFKTKQIPDNRIVFASPLSGNYDVFSGSIAGNDSIQLTSNFSRDWYPRLSPVRDKIAFSSDRDIETHIYIMNRDGSGVSKITSVPLAGYNNFGRGFCWSPNGKKLLYANYKNLYQIDADGDGLKQISTAPDDRNYLDLDWSPVGNKIAALVVGNNTNSGELYLMNSDGTDAQLLLDNMPGSIGHPAFSPAGDKIAFYYDISGYQGNNGRMMDSRILIIAINGSDTTDISTHKPVGTNDVDPVWSPDGSKIIFTNVVNDNTEPPSVWIMDMNGDNRLKLFDNALMPDWR